MKEIREQIGSSGFFNEMCVVSVNQCYEMIHHIPARHTQTNPQTSEGPKGPCRMCAK